MLRLIFLFSSFVFVSWSFLIPLSGNDRIVGGLPTNIQKFPYQVSLQAYQRPSHFCAGSIIDDYWIVTAAHCVTRSWYSYYVRIGSTYHAEGGYIFNVSKVFSHPKFHNTDSDIALLQLSKPITISTKTAIIDLPNQDYKVETGSKVKVSGWGRTLNPEESNDGLRYVEVYTIDQEICAKNYSVLPKEITDNMFCAGYPGGGKDSCQGDSGGPISFNNELIGIVSWGEGCALESFPGVYTRVSAFRNWIYNITQI